MKLELVVDIDFDDEGLVDEARHQVNEMLLSPISS
jgi:hypothetical protein